MRPPADRGPAGAGVGYLVSQYPALSHTFIEREVRGVRASGLRVDTFSVRPATPGDVLSAADREAVAGTTVLQRLPPSAWVRAFAPVLRHPVGYLGVLWRARHRGARGVRAAVWRLFYAVEATLLVGQLARRGLRHVHVHLANNGADIGRLAAELGNALHRRSGRWTWSFTMHGPTEFRDVTAFDLAGKVRSALFVACISEYCRSQLQLLVEPPFWDKLTVLHMGIEPERFPPLAATRSRRPPGPLRILFVGRLVPDKGPSLLVRAVSELVATGQEVELALVGNGPLRQELEELATAAGIAGRVQLPGGVGQDDILGWYEWADVFCLPSFAEGLPVVLMEALATELPVVTTGIVGIPELVVDGVNGRLVVPGRSDVLVEAIMSLVPAETRRACGTAGRKAVLDGFVAADTSRALAEVFRGTLELPPPVLRP